MKLKTLKKNIKHQIFNINFSKNPFIIFEIELTTSTEIFSFKIRCESFAKQTFNKLKLLEFKDIKFPNKIKFTKFVVDFIKYLQFMKEKKYFFNIYMVKMHFIIVNKDISIFFNVFTNKKIFCFCGFLFASLVKKRGLLLPQSNNGLSFPFFMV